MSDHNLNQDSFSESKLLSPQRRRKSASLPQETVDYLKNWIMSEAHIAHPYPTEQEKAQIMRDTGIEMKQLTNWFVNNRKRYWKPRVEARLREQQKVSSDGKSDSPSKKVQLTNLSLGDVVDAMTKTTSSSGRTSTAAVVSPGRLISAQSSVASAPSEDDSSEGSVSGGDTSDDAVRREYVSVHVLKPVVGTQPTMADVVVGKCGDSEVLHSFTGCNLTYRCASRDVTKIRSRRNAEVESLKKMYLRRFLDEVDFLRPAKRQKLAVRRGDADLPSPRPMFRRRSMELWQEACVAADHCYDQKIPNLEEAATLFGYSD